MYGLDLFSGIGGITQALKGYVEPVVYCERDRYAQAVLLSRMSAGELPIAPIWDDVTTLTGGGAYPLASTSSTEVSPARTSLSETQMVAAWMVSAADFSLRSLGSLASYDQVSCSLRTYQRLMFEEQSELLESCVAYGMTVDGVLFQLVPWAPHTIESGGFYLPTPMASDAEAWTKVNRTDVQRSIAKTLIKSMDRLTYRFQWLSLSLRHVAEYVEWMMGYPKKWTELSHWVIPWYQSKREKRLKG